MYSDYKIMFLKFDAKLLNLISYNSIDNKSIYILLVYTQFIDQNSH